MSNQSLYDDDSYIELKNRLEILKLKKIIEFSLFNDKFKDEVNSYLFLNDKKLNEELSNEVLRIDDIITIIINTIKEMEDNSPDILTFKNEIKLKIDNFYNDIKKPVLFNIFNSLSQKKGVFYTTPYIVLDNRKGDKLSEISQGIYDYKEFGRHIDYFTRELMKAITFISNEKISADIDNIALVCIPRSTKGLESTIQESIDIIEKWYDTAKTDLDFGCSKKIINCKGLLTRFKTIGQSSKGAYLFKEDHINSIKCNMDSEIDLDNTVFILLDDITTHGTIMHACRDILTSENIKFTSIYMLAIGGTRGY